MGTKVQTPASGYELMKLKEQQSHKHIIIIGIDTGTNTGVAIWDVINKDFMKIETMKIHKAMKLIETCIYSFGLDNIHVRFEDARLRKWFGNAGREQLQGAGSIKRDCSVWEDYLTDLKVSFEPVAPKANITKIKADMFKKITGYQERTTEHSRDAAFLVYNF